MRSLFFLLSMFLIISCNTQQKTIENTKEKTASTVNSAIIDSVNAQHDKIATSEKRVDSVLYIRHAFTTSKKPTSTIKNEKKVDSVLYIRHAKFTTSKEPTSAIKNEKKVDSVLYIRHAKFTTSKEPNLDIISKNYLNHHYFNNLLKKHVTATGNVNYKGFKKDQLQLRRYISFLGGHMPTDNWSKEEKLAYWINAYNALTIDLIIRNYPLKSIKDIKKPWDQRLWKLGEKWYNLDEIEHKILRKMNDPRIHFAINCASFSCPPLLNEAFSSANLEEQLTQVTKAFLADSKRNKITSSKIEISKIFKWFSKDFKQNGSLIDFLNQYSTVKIDANAKKSYQEYNWDLNE